MNLLRCKCGELWNETEGFITCWDCRRPLKPEEIKSCTRFESAINPVPVKRVRAEQQKIRQQRIRAKAKRK